MDWPRYKRAADLSGDVFPVSEDVILSTARKHDIGRKMGRAIIFSADDCARLYEMLPCPSSSSSGQDHHTGSSAGQSAESALKKALALATTTPTSRPSGRRKSARNGKPNYSGKASTDVRRQPLSEKLP